MEKNGWRLKSLTFPHVYCSANGDFDRAEAQTILPAVEANAFTRDGHGFAINLVVNWGTPGKAAPYDVQIHAFGSFELAADKLDVSSADEADIRRSLDEVMSLKGNAVQVVYGAAREMVATVSSRGPWGTIYLPIYMIDEGSCPLHVGHDLSKRLRLDQDQDQDADKPKHASAGGE
jgi:hypothetical protein